MNKQTILSSVFSLLSMVGLWAQKSKTYKETFNIGQNAVLNINTSHADIEFETWDKNQVEIEAVVTLEGASEEEADNYFDHMNFEIKGNSREIEVTTGVENTWFFKHATGGFQMDDFNFDIEPLILDLELPELPEMAVIPEMPPLPPMPPIQFKNFDYSKYKDGGEKYLKDWAESLEESFGEDYQEKMEEWSERMEERAKEWEDRNAGRLQRLEKRMEERAAEMEKRREELVNRRSEIAEKRQNAMQDYHIRRKALVGKRKINEGEGDSEEIEPNIFFFSSDYGGKKYEVKKTIKIKMPKSVKLKMNVKHGEVKLAANTKQINASLRYASLLASDIGGKKTDIQASYSPLFVKNWEDGKMEVKYCNKVNLEKVKNLSLKSTSSDVVIGSILNDVEVENEYGHLNVNQISKDAKRLFVKVIDGELRAKVPNEEFNLYLFEDYSNVSYPKTIKIQKMDISMRENNFVVSGDDKRRNPSLIINAKYSEVTLKE